LEGASEPVFSVLLPPYAGGTSTLGSEVNETLPIYWLVFAPVYQ
jgi:hypothetical protein